MSVCLLNACYVPGILLGAGSKTVNKIDKVTVLGSLSFSVGKQRRNTTKLLQNMSGSYKYHEGIQSRVVGINSCVRWGCYFFMW